ncbi:MAG: hypothetical protein Kow0026_24070 [Oricola sp.]
MSVTDKKTDDQEKGDEVLRRMLKTPPKPNVKESDKGSTNKDRAGDGRRPTNQSRD